MSATLHYITLKRGDTVFLRKSNRMIKAELMATYDYPAVRIRLSGNGTEFIVQPIEIVTEEQRNATLRETARKKHSELLKCYRGGMTSAQWQAVRGSWSIGEWSAILGMRRLGVIT